VRPEIQPEEWDAEQGLFSPLKMPEFGLWRLVGMDEDFRERFQTCAAEAAVALGCPKDANLVYFWLHWLFFDLRKNHSKLLLVAYKNSGRITHACKGSATFCLRLKREALGTETAAKVTKVPRRSVNPQGFSDELCQKLRDEKWLKTQPSLRQKEAAFSLAMSDRQIRNLVDKQELHVSPKKRVALDGAFFSQFHLKHFAPK
jgi:hypothetical protein